MKRILFLILTLIILFTNSIYAASTTPSDNSSTPPDVSCANAILIELETGKILYEKDAYTKVYPASTTKILTAILALENCELNEEITASYNAIMSVPYDGTTAAIQVGETWTVKNLVDAMMVCSANEAANVLAEHLGGSIESFSSMMNSRAKELGAKSTNFVNANGLHDDKHQTTVYDMAIIARHGMLNLPYFRTAATLTNFSLPKTVIYDKEDRNFINTNRMLIKNSSYYYQYATGIKTGYTSKALNCIVASAKKDDVELIAVVFGATGAQNRTKDTIALFEYGFTKMKNQKLALKNAALETLKIKGAPSDKAIVKAVLKEDVTHTIPTEKNIADYTPKIEITKELKAPITSGELLGTATYDIEGIKYTYNLYASNDVESVMNNVTAGIVTTTKIIGKIILWAVISVILMIIALILLRAAILTKKQKIRRRRMTLYNSRFR